MRSLVSNGVRYHVGEEAALVDGHVDVTQRLKRVPTIIDKLDREPKMKLTRMGDLGASGRVSQTSTASSG